MHWHRSLGLIVVGLLLIAALVWGFRPQPVLVDAARVERGPMTVEVAEEGRTRVKDRFVISAPVAGYARRIALDVGDSVSQGQVIAELEPLRSDVLDPRRRAEAEARVSAAQASVSAAEERVQAARAEAELARAEYVRRQELCEDACVSREEVDRAEAAWRRAKAGLHSAEFSAEAARFELAAARTALEHSAAREAGEPLEHVDIRAPVGGNVLKLYHESEGVVEAGSPLLEVGDPAALEVEVDVLSADAVRIHPGTRVLLERWGGDQQLEGLVRTVEPVGFTKVSALGVEEQRVWVIVDITSPRDQWQRLGDGYRIEARFVLWQEDDVLQVPASALFRHGDEWAVFVVEDNHVRRQTVQVGRRTGLRAQIGAGLDAGEIVITHPDDAIEQGSSVELRTEI